MRFEIAFAIGYLLAVLSPSLVLIRLPDTETPYAPDPHDWCDSERGLG